MHIISFDLFIIDSTSSASSSSNNESVKTSTTQNVQTTKKNSTNTENQYKSLNALIDQNHLPNTSNGTTDHNVALKHQNQLSSPRIIINQRSHSRYSNHSLSKTTSNSITDLSLSLHNQKLTTTANRRSLFQSKLDYCNNESYKKVSLAQNYDWGILAITNTDLILLYSKDKHSLVIFDADGHENEVKTSKIIMFTSITIY